ncbi:MAG: FtsQ-type POTRA domain-containing protein [Clostridiales bacterium]|nr:FtsQ-type POTRA domain-containing protein [Clostridiales bacterium]
MTAKKNLAKIIAIAFAFVVLLACFGIFTVSKIDVSYAVSSYDVHTAESILNNYKGKNILFLDEQDVIDDLKSMTYLEVQSVEKKYPNVLSVNITERRETYKMTFNDKTYILDENGVALNDSGEIKQGVSVIDLDFITFRNNPNLTSKIEVTDVVLGQKIKTTSDETVFKSLEIAKQFGLFDCVKSVTIEDCSGGEYDVSFETHTGVKIYIIDILVDGETKGQVGFEAYNTKANDYQKRFGLLETRYSKENGVNKLVVDHTYDQIDADNRNDYRLYEQII